MFLQKTKRLLLRKFTEDDLEALAAILAKKEVMEFSSRGCLTREKAREYLQEILDHYAKYDFGLYAVIHKEDQCLIGYVGLSVQQLDGEEKVELGYRLDPQYWGKGLATEAALAICQYAFETLKMTQLISIIHSKNMRSIKVAKAVGMSFWKESVFYHQPVHVYQLKR